MTGTGATHSFTRMTLDLEFPPMSGLTAELDRLERALERLDAAMAAQAERSQTQIDEIADRVRTQAVTEIETELREDTATVAARVNQVIQRIETLLEK